MEVWLNGKKKGFLLDETFARCQGGLLRAARNDTLLLAHYLLFIAHCQLPYRRHHDHNSAPDNIKPQIPNIRLPEQQEHGRLRSDAAQKTTRPPIFGRKNATTKMPSMVP